MQLSAEAVSSPMTANVRKATGAIAMLAIGAALVGALVIVVDVLGRWLFSTSIFTLNEIVSMVFAVAVAFTLPAGAAQRVNLRIDLLAHLTGPGLTAWLRVAGSVMLLLFFGLLAWRLFGLSFRYWDTGRASALLQMPLAAATALVGVVGAMGTLGPGAALNTFAGDTGDFLRNEQVATLPMFLIMGSFAVVAGVSDDLFRLGHALLGRFRGGLAYATVLGCAGFGAVSGNSIATSDTFGRMALPAMSRAGYAPALATGSVAAGGTLGALVPPSGVLVLFALLTESSIGALFVAAMIYSLIFGGLMFAFFINLGGIPDMMSAWVASIDARRIVVLVVLILVYLLLGSVMDSFAVMIITVPVITPIVLSMGCDILFWGILMLMVVEIGMISPPFGMNLFILKSIDRDVRLGTVMRGVLPFVTVDFVKVVLLVAFPALALWLPSTM